MPRLSPSLGLVAASFLVALGTGPSVGAAQCPAPPLAPVEVTPAVGAQGVTIDAWVMVRYGEGYFGPEGPGDDPETLVSLERCGECGSRCDVGVPVPGRVEVLGDDLFYVPDGPLGARTQYRGVANGFEGSLDFSFCTGDERDVGAPEFSQAVRFDPIESDDPCEVPGGGYRVGIYAPPANDDGPGGSLEYLLFLTRATGLDAPVLVDRVRNFSAGEITMYLFLDRERAASSVCVRLGVIDGVGNVTMGDEESCFDPVSRIAFQGCAVSGPGLRTLQAPARAGVPRGFLALALLGLALAGTRRERRRPGS